MQTFISYIRVVAILSTHMVVNVLHFMLELCQPTQRAPR